MGRRQAGAIGAAAGNSASSDTVVGYGGGVYGLTYGYGNERIEISDNVISGNATRDIGGGVQLTLFPTIIDDAINHQHVNPLHRSPHVPHWRHR